MAFMTKEIIDLKGFLIMALLTVPLIAATNLDCNGKAFRCVNSTHFMICVDLGTGISTTIDDFVMPCPLTTVCRSTNRFECEFPSLKEITEISTTTTKAPSETVKNDVASLNRDSATPVPFEEYYNTISTTTISEFILNQPIAENENRINASESTIIFDNVTENSTASNVDKDNPQNNLFVIPYESNNIFNNQKLASTLNIPETVITDAPSLSDINESSIVSTLATATTESTTKEELLTNDFSNNSEKIIPNETKESFTASSVGTENNSFTVSYEYTTTLNNQNISTTLLIPETEVTDMPILSEIISSIKNESFTVSSSATTEQIITEQYLSNDLPHDSERIILNVTIENSTASSVGKGNVENNSFIVSYESNNTFNHPNMVTTINIPEIEEIDTSTLNESISNITNKSSTTVSGLKITESTITERLTSNDWPNNSERTIPNVTTESSTAKSVVKVIVENNSFVVSYESTTTFNNLNMVTTVIIPETEVTYMSSLNTSTGDIKNKPSTISNLETTEATITEEILTINDLPNNSHRTIPNATIEDSIATFDGIGNVENNSFVVSYESTTSFNNQNMVTTVIVPETEVTNIPMLSESTDNIQNKLLTGLETTEQTITEKLLKSDFPNYAERTIPNEPVEPYSSTARLIEKDIAQNNSFVISYESLIKLNNLNTTTTVTETNMPIISESTDNITKTTLTKDNLSSTESAVTEQLLIIKDDYSENKTFQQQTVEKSTASYIDHDILQSNLFVIPHESSNIPDSQKFAIAVNTSISEKEITDTLILSHKTDNNRNDLLTVSGLITTESTVVEELFIKDSPNNFEAKTMSEQAIETSTSSYNEKEDNIHTNSFVIPYVNNENLYSTVIVPNSDITDTPMLNENEIDKLLTVSSLATPELTVKDELLTNKPMSNQTRKNSTATYVDMDNMENNLFVNLYETSSKTVIVPETEILSTSNTSKSNGNISNKPATVSSLTITDTTVTKEFSTKDLRLTNLENKSIFIDSSLKEDTNLNFQSTTEVGALGNMLKDITLDYIIETTDSKDKELNLETSTNYETASILKHNFNDVLKLSNSLLPEPPLSITTKEITDITTNKITTTESSFLNTNSNSFSVSDFTTPQTAIIKDDLLVNSGKSSENSFISEYISEKTVINNPWNKETAYSTISSQKEQFIPETTTLTSQAIEIAAINSFKSLENSNDTLIIIHVDDTSLIINNTAEDSVTEPLTSKKDDFTDREDLQTVSSSYNQVTISTILTEKTDTKLATDSEKGLSGLDEKFDEAFNDQSIISSAATDMSSDKTIVINDISHKKFSTVTENTLIYEKTSSHDTNNNVLANDIIEIPSTEHKTPLSAELLTNEDFKISSYYNITETMPIKSHSRTKTNISGNVIEMSTSSNKNFVITTETSNIPSIISDESIISNSNDNIILEKNKDVSSQIYLVINDQNNSETGTSQILSTEDKESKSTPNLNKIQIDYLSSSLSTNTDSPHTSTVNESIDETSEIPKKSLSYQSTNINIITNLPQTTELSDVFVKKVYQQNTKNLTCELLDRLNSNTKPKSLETRNNNLIQEVNKELTEAEDVKITPLIDFTKEDNEKLNSNIFHDNYGNFTETEIKKSESNVSTSNSINKPGSVDVTDIKVEILQQQIYQLEGNDIKTFENTTSITLPPTTLPRIKNITDITTSSYMLNDLTATRESNLHSEVNKFNNNVASGKETPKIYTTPNLPNVTINYINQFNTKFDNNFSKSSAIPDIIKDSTQNITINASYKNTDLTNPQSIVDKEGILKNSTFLSNIPHDSIVGHESYSDHYNSVTVPHELNLTNLKSPIYKLLRTKDATSSDFSKTSTKMILIQNLQLTTEYSDAKTVTEEPKNIDKKLVPSILQSISDFNIVSENTNDQEILTPITENTARITSIKNKSIKNDFNIRTEGTTELAESNLQEIIPAFVAITDLPIMKRTDIWKGEDTETNQQIITNVNNLELTSPSLATANNVKATDQEVESVSTKITQNFEIPVNNITNGEIVIKNMPGKETHSGIVSLFQKSSTYQKTKNGEKKTEVSEVEDENNSTRSSKGNAVNEKLSIYNEDKLLPYDNYKTDVRTTTKSYSIHDQVGIVSIGELNNEDSTYKSPVSSRPTINYDNKYIQSTNNVSNIQSSTPYYSSETKISITTDYNYPTTRYLELQSTTPKPNAAYYDCKQKRGRYANKQDCRKFYICLGNGHVIAGTCPINTVFSEIRKQCTNNLSHCVQNNQFQCLIEGRFSDYLDENVYYICVKKNVDSFVRFKFQCMNGYHLNKASVKCDFNKESLQSDSNSESSSTTETSESSPSIQKDEKPEKFECKKEGKFPDISNPRRYFECTKKDNDKYQQKKKKCKSNKIFDKKKKTCVDEDSDTSNESG